MLAIGIGGLCLSAYMGWRALRGKPSMPRALNSVFVSGAFGAIMEAIAKTVGHRNKDGREPNPAGMVFWWGLMGVVWIVVIVRAVR